METDTNEHSETYNKDKKWLLAFRGIWDPLHESLTSCIPNWEDQKDAEWFLELLNRLLKSKETNRSLKYAIMQPYSQKFAEFNKQYCAYSVWLFGLLFSLLEDKSSASTNETLQGIIDDIVHASMTLQAFFLRLLSRFNLPLHEEITQKYVDILNDLGNVKERNSPLTICAFKPDESALEDVKLDSYPVVVKPDRVAFIQLSILQIILDSNVPVWNQKALWRAMVQIVENANFEIKDLALEIICELMQSPDSEVIEDVVVSFMEQIINILPGCDVPPETINHYIQVYIKLIHELSVSGLVANLCFAIIDAVANGYYTSHELQQTACYKIRQYLKEHPICYDRADNEKLIFYCKRCENFAEVLIHYIFCDVKYAQLEEEIVTVSQVSSLWTDWKQDLKASITSNNFRESLLILQAIGLLNIWFKEHNISVRFFDEDGDSIQESLIRAITMDTKPMHSVIFENLVELISFKEMRSLKLELILSLPWTNSRRLGSLIEEYSEHLTLAAKCLDDQTKIKSLNACCENLNTKQYLPSLQRCILNKEEKLATSSILCTPLLLSNGTVDMETVFKKWLQTAYEMEKVEFRLPVAVVLGQLICLSSGCGKLTRKSWDSKDWVVDCKYCDHNKCPVAFYDSVVSASTEKLIFPLLNLLESNSEEIRLCLSENLHRFSSHTRIFNSNDVTKKWLPYMRDGNANIRNKIAVAVGFILKNKLNMLSFIDMSPESNVPDELDSFVDLVIDELVKTLMEAVYKKNESLHLSLIATAKCFSWTRLHLTEKRICTMFLHTILHPASSLIAINDAIEAYKDLVKHVHGISPRDMFTRYKTHFLDIMIRFAAVQHVNGSHDLETFLCEAAKCFGFEGPKQLVKKELPLVACNLLAQAIKRPNVIHLLSEISVITNIQQESDIVLNNFSLMYTHLCLNETPEDAAKGFKLIEDITRASKSDLIAGTYNGTLFQILLYLGEKEEKVLECLVELIRIEKKHEGMPIPNLRIYIQTHLKPSLHWILVQLNTTLRSKFDEYTLKCALSALTALINFMNQDDIAAFRYLIMNILRTSLGLKRPGFKHLCCDAFSAFIHNTEISFLGIRLPTICVSMIPLLEYCPKKTNEILEYLIIQNKPGMSEYISELFFIEDMNVSPDIADVVKQHIRKARSRKIGSNLNMWLKRIENETEEVRLKAFTYLKRFLAEHRGEINNLITKDITVDPLITKLLNSLLSGCQDKNEAVRLASGECLGELGAVEPSLLPRKIISRSDVQFIPEMNEDFACAALMEVSRSLQMEESTKSDTFSLAIQEILKAFKISNTGENKALWDRFPPTMQDIIFPFLTSRYTSEAKGDQKYIHHPIYGSEAGSTFESWAYNWVCSISKNVRDPVIETMLANCKLAFKHDIRIAIFFLPYIVVDIVASEKVSSSRKIIEEMLAVIKVNEQTKLDKKLSTYYPIHSEFNKLTTSERVSDEIRRVHCSQVVFSVVDYLNKWLIQQRKKKDNKYQAVKDFCGHLDYLVLAECSYQSYEYHRSLLYLEQHISLNNIKLSGTKEGDLLAKIYTQLEEPDGISGILATQEQFPNLQQQILSYEVYGQLHDAATCYEMVVKTKSPDTKYLQGLIQCYLELNQPFTAMSLAKGILNSKPELEPIITEQEAFWKLANWGTLDDLSEKSVKSTILNDLKGGIKPDLSGVKKKLVSLLRSPSYPGAYQESYTQIMKLHVLNEFEKAASLMLDDVKCLPMIFEEWDKRGQLLRTSRGQEFVLNMRRATLDLALKLQEERNETQCSTLKEEIGKLCLKSAKIARKAALYQQADSCIIAATNLCAPQELYLEQSQLHWQKGCHEEAINTLDRCLKNHFKSIAKYKIAISEKDMAERKQCAKVRLLFAKYNDEKLNVDVKRNIANYKEVLEVWGGWEKSLVALAQYYESIVDKLSAEDKDLEGREYQEQMILHYGKSLQYGCKYIHESMPRMLTVYLDFASRMNERKSSPGQRASFRTMVQHMDGHVKTLPAYMWFTAISQVISRLTHSDEEVQKTLAAILIKVTLEHPQHSLWAIAYVYNSYEQEIQKRCQEILKNSSLRTREMTTLIKDFERLWARFIELTKKRIEEKNYSSVMSVTYFSKSLPKLLRSPDFSGIMMPTTKCRQLEFPTKSAAVLNHTQSSMSWVQIRGIEDKVMIVGSMQKPRKIELIGSDGKKYPFLAKPNDDLRKDCRLMEFGEIVNKCLKKDPESCRRRLYMRTYGVVPLNEDCGLIEWLPNLIGIRPVIVQLHNERGIKQIKHQELRTKFGKPNDPIEMKRKAFQECKNIYVPVLGDWFRLMFPDAYGWYEARSAFIRTTAAMSMIGFVLGLGDRHGENILLDSKSGDTVHVDFNMIFNAGEKLQYPERVPFRLTQNMTHAMGPLSYEGPFRKSCETTMRVLREQIRALMSVLTPFVYDHLDRSGGQNIKDIEQRLKGFVQTKEKIQPQFSVEGQVNRLILEATDFNHLCQMFVGWGPYY